MSRETRTIIGHQLDLYDAESAKYPALGSASKSSRHVGLVVATTVVTQRKVRAIWWIAAEIKIEGAP